MVVICILRWLNYIFSTFSGATGNCSSPATPRPITVPTPSFNAVDTLWVLIATGLVLLMTPALALFYGGLVRTKNILNTMMMSVGALGVVGIVWALAGYSLAFAPGGAWLGGLDHLGLRGVGLDLRRDTTIPQLLFFAYQGTFAVITAALISGAIVERMKYTAYLLFIALWSLVVYAPVAHWVWGGGWLGTLGVLDFAGGTVVHITAGSAAAVAAVMVGRRRSHGRQAFLPHNVPMMLTGASLLWFGWLGFNGGSALAVNGIAVQAAVNTILAPMATLATWMAIDAARTGRTTAVGAGTAIVVGLVAITPACGFVSPASALAIGAIAALPCYYAILKRAGTRLDDSLDVLGAHGTGGVTGALLTGVFAQRLINPIFGAGKAVGGLDGHWGQVGNQLVGVLIAWVFALVGTFVLLKIVDLLTGVRVPEEHEVEGLDVTQHGEEAYNLES